MRAALPAAPKRRAGPALALALVAAGALGGAWASDGTGDGPPARGTEATLQQLLEPLEEHPSLRAARASVRAAERELDGVRSPVALEASYGTSQIRTEADDRWEDDLALDARLRPFRFGDLADAEVRAEVTLERARLELRRARAELEASAVEAAADLLTARRAVELSERSLAVAQAAADTTRLRAERGAADDLERERAELEVERARSALSDARMQRDLARQAATDLVGEQRLDALPELPIAEGPAPRVRDAELDLRTARVGRSGALRDLAPTANVSYAWNLDQGALSVSLESRTLQPTVGYEHPGRFGGSGGAGGAAAPAQVEPPEVQGAFTIGVSMTLSPERFHALDAAEARVEGADEAVDAARRHDEAAARGREGAVATAERSLALARRERQLAQRELEVARERAELDLETPLAVARSELALAEAERTLFDARVTHLARVLDTYRDTATPLSEVLP